MSSTPPDPASLSSTPPSPTSTESRQPDPGTTWSANEPSQALFYLAIVIGVFIAVLFVFFSLRYFVRAKIGVLFSGSSNSDLRELTEVHHNVFDPAYPIRDVVPFGRFGFAFPTIDTHSSPLKFSKRFRLTTEELDYLFPERTYSDWLNGGAERDALDRDIHIKIKYCDSNSQDGALNDDNKGQASKEKSVVSNVDIDDVQSIKSVLSVHQPPKEIHYEDDTCAICIDEFTPNDIVRGLICGHVFHKTCVDPWLSNRKACCPLCKRDYYLRNRIINDGDGSGSNNSGSHDENENNDHRFDLMTEEEVTRLRETERIMSQNHRIMIELSALGRPSARNNSNSNDAGDGQNATEGTATPGAAEPANELALRNIEAYNEYLNSLRPLSVRATEALESHPELEEIAKAKVESQYFTWRFRFFWRLMGITKDDLIHSVIVSRYEDILQEEQQTQREQEENTQELATEVPPGDTASIVHNHVIPISPEAGTTDAGNGIITTTNPENHTVTINFGNQTPEVNDSDSVDIAENRPVPSDPNSEAFEGRRTIVERMV
ncbi:hypothetical protein DASC09_046360 [Saccharomycopsis crataegensis]|uniref:RING-type domain-containing protein n=1 Tax=Saccharomycopsis crataegensis TaxID=43959 RepID=A0AAV5QRZ7_9ASCO|nr:hypothetical protein DASC09_046360 [Saccharomycopsis crataegensis]